MGEEMAKAPPGKDNVPLPASLLHVVDVLAVATVLPVFIMAWIAIRSAWLVFHPRRRPVKQNPQTYGLSAERIDIAGADGVRLTGWFIPRSGARDAVVLGHGMGASSGPLMPLARALHDAGYHILAFDMRNHGDSADDKLFRGQSRRIGTDFHNVVKYLRDRPGLGDCQVACLGISMSAWTALDTARLEPGLVRAVICDSGPTMDMPGVMSRMFGVYRQQLPRLLRGPLMFGLGRAIFRRASEFFLVPAAWPPDLGAHRPPILFIGGEADPVTRPSDIREMAARYPWATIWLVPRAGHMQPFTLAPGEYYERVTELLAQAFGRADVPRSTPGGARGQA